MRDDFSVSVKDLLAKRVAFQCSRLGCGQVTSGPQADPTKHINVGVAAHITAASQEGPRYDPALTPEERSSVNNGVWLCQTCAKMVDNDPVRDSVETLREWKRFAEDRATQALEGRSIVSYVAVAAFRRIERLLPELLAEMRRDLVTHPLRRECVLLQRVWTYTSNGSEFFAYYFEDHTELASQFQVLENYGLVANVTSGSVTRYRITEDLAEYLGVV